MNYKALSTAEKLAEIADCNFWGEETALAEEYALAVADGNRAVIEDYESFGNSPRQFIMNKREYARAVSVFGFTEKRFNEHGWLVVGAFMDCEEFAFNAKGLLMGHNSVSIGRSPSNKWAYGLNLAASVTGRCPERCQYDYRHTDGVLFSCVAKSLEDARARRDKWVKALRNMTDSEYALKRENGSFLCPRCHSSSGIEEEEPLDWSNPSIDSEYAVIRLSCPCGCRWTEILRPVGYEIEG